MATDCDMTVPDDEPSVAIVDTAWGTVVRTRDVLDFVAAVWLRRVSLRLRHGGRVLLDLRAVRVAEPVAVAAVAGLAAEVWAREGALRVVRSPQTPPVVVRAAGAPVFGSLTEAFGGASGAPDAQLVDQHLQDRHQVDRPRPDQHQVDPPDRPSGRRPPATGGPGGTSPDRSPPPPGEPVRTRPAPLRVPHPRRADRD